jgi:hypothetical protein
MTLIVQTVGVLFIGQAGIDHHGIWASVGGFFCGMICQIRKM